MMLRGLYTALITPFDEGGGVDSTRLRYNIRAQIQHGVDGIVLLGTTGETPTLTDREKEQIIQIGVEEAKNRATILVGTGSYSTEKTIDNTRRAKELGADGALVVTPYYNKPTPEGIFRHFKALTEATHFPICLYNIQGRTGVNLQTQTLLRLADLSHIIGVKEASGNLAQMDEVVQAFAARPDFSVLSGDDALTLPLMALGGHGVISVTSNLALTPMKELIKACSKMNFTSARQLHRQLTPLFKALFIETNPIPLKAAMHLLGMDSGVCRLPLCELLPENRKKLKALIQEIPEEWLVLKKNLITPLAFIPVSS
jgi:4-hydroxy-tetrahydrodipicolinate synthase